MSSRPMRILASLLVAVLVCLPVACTSESVEEFDAGTDLGPAVVRIGFAAPLTGEDSERAAGMLRAAELAIKDANNSWEIEDAGLQLVLSVVDDQGDLELGYEVARELAADPSVIAVVGHSCSDVALFVAPVYEEAGLPLITIATSPLLTDRGHEMIDRITPREDLQGVYAAELALGSLDLTSAVVVDDGTFLGGAVSQAFAATYIQEGGPVLARLHLSGEEMNEESVVSVVVESGARVVFVGGEPDFTALISRALHSQGVDIPVIVKGWRCSIDHLALAGEAAEGDISIGISVPLDQHDRGKDFRSYYMTAYGIEPTEWDAFAYDAVWVVVRAVLEAGPDRGEVAEAIRSMEFQGVMGTMHFDEAGDTTNRVMSAYRVVDGEWEVIP